MNVELVTQPLPGFSCEHCSLTTDGAEGDYLKDGFNGDLAGILRPLHRGVLAFTGFSVLRPHVVYGPARQPAEERASELEQWRTRLVNIFDELPIEIGVY